MTDEEHKLKLKLKVLWAWAERHGYKRISGGRYERDRVGPGGGICSDRLVVDHDVVRYEWGQAKPPYGWDSQVEGWLKDIVIDPTTDKLTGFE